MKFGGTDQHGFHSHQTTGREHNPSGDDATRNQNNWRQRFCYNGDREKRQQSVRSVDQDFTAFENCQDLRYIKRIVKNCRMHHRLDFQAAVQNVAYKASAKGGVKEVVLVKG